MLGCAFLGWLILSTGCATTGSLFSAPSSVSEEPWRLPATAYPSQRLYRVKYHGPEGDAGFKLTLYLEAESEYRMLASDLGRKLWSLSVDGQGDALWLNYREKRYCRADATTELRFLPLADLPLASLPRLLLGRLPAEPVADLARGERNVTFLDARGFRWNGELDGDRLQWWSLVEGGEAVVWWRREEHGGVFSNPRGKQEVRWREVVREQLRSPLAEVEIPAKFSPGDCDATGS